MAPLPRTRNAHPASGMGMRTGWCSSNATEPGIGLLDPQALAAAGADWNDFNRAVGDAVWILHDSLQDLPGFDELGMEPQRLFDTEIAARRWD